MPKPMTAKNREFVGTAAWKVPKSINDRFSLEGSHLERYAKVFNAVEINSSFYREHQPKTYLKWAQAVPREFRFAVKLAKRITHLQRLAVESDDLKTTVSGYMELGEKLGVVLVQLPPSLEFDREQALVFFETLRLFYFGGVVIEPRNRSWKSADALELLRDFNVTLAAVDPDPCDFNSRAIAIHNGLAYFRLHGTPEMYRSRYDLEAIEAWKQRMLPLRAPNTNIWCMFDNTTFDHATLNALELQDLLQKPKRSVAGHGQIAI